MIDASLGYHRPRYQRISRNQISVNSHPSIINDELSKELQLQRITVPFDSSLMASLQCSGVRKQEIEEWSCTYLPLSINDGLLKNDLLISSIVRIINWLGSGTLLAKIDITLHHTSVSEDTELFTGGTSSMETAAFHLGYARCPTSSVADLDFLEGGLITTLACEILEAISILRWNHAYFDRINYQPYRFVFNKFSAKAC